MPSLFRTWSPPGLLHSEKLSRPDLGCPIQWQEQTERRPGVNNYNLESQQSISWNHLLDVDDKGFLERC
uniref:Uncharacterized protein n=1 Tax=Romanomermis culicivorax TaxID=13658 RepID=A0A915IER7_ROMCU